MKTRRPATQSEEIVCLSLDVMTWADGLNLKSQTQQRRLHDDFNQLHNNNEYIGTLC